MNNLNSLSIAPHQDGFEYHFGPVSLNFSLFLLAPPTVCLKMMDEGKITNLNEKNQKDISLLALKLKSPEYHDFKIPTWDQWERYQQDLDTVSKNKNTNPDEQPVLWVDTPKDPPSSFLCASMIFAGADPWVNWNAEDFNGKSNCFFAHAIDNGCSELVNLLLSHPNCPSAAELDKITFKKISLRSDGYSTRFSNLEELPLMHAAANMSKPDIVQALIKKGMDVNILDSKKRSPLYYTLEEGIAGILLNNNARATFKDVNNETVGMFWKKVFSTAAKQSEFNKLLIENLKGRVTHEELLELQKPDLFNEVASGTKTAFLAIFRKSKFPSDVTMERGDLVFNIMTEALLRKDDKTHPFMNFCDEKNISWGHQISEKEPMLTNAMLAMILINSQYDSNEYKNFLKKKYEGQKEKFFNDFFASLKEICHKELDAFNALHLLIHYDKVNAGIKSKVQAYNLSYGIDKFKKLGATQKMIIDAPEDGQSMPVVLGDHPMYFSTLSHALKSVFLIYDEKKSYRSYRNVNENDFVTLSKKLISDASTNPEAIHSLTWLTAASYGWGLGETSYYNNDIKTETFKQREENLSFLKNQQSLFFSEDEFMLAQETMDQIINAPQTGHHKVSFETAPRFVSMLSSFHLKNNLSSENSISIKRRM